MRKLPITLVGIIAAASAIAGPFDFTIQADVQYNGASLPDAVIMQNETPRWVVELRNAGKKQNPPSGSYAIIRIAEDLTADAYIQAISSSTGTYSYVCQFAAMNTNATDWVYTINLYDGSSNVYWSGSGAVDITASTSISSTGTVDTTVPFSLPSYTVTPTGASGEVLTSGGDGSWSWTGAGSGDITGVAVDGGLLTGGGTSGDVTVTLTTGAVNNAEADAIALADLATHEALEGTNVHGLGTASTNATGDFATAAQGALADSAIQTELDPVWEAEKSGYLPLSGGTMIGTLHFKDLIGGNISASMSGGIPAYSFLMSDADGDTILTISKTERKLYSGSGVTTLDFDAQILNKNVFTDDPWSSDGVPTDPDHIVNKAYGDASYSLASFQGAREDLSTTTALTWLPTKYSAKWSPSAAATFAMSTDADYPRATYSLWVYSTDTITFDGDIELQNSITPSGTNLWVIAPSDTTDTWVAVGRAF